LIDRLNQPKLRPLRALTAPLATGYRMQKHGYVIVDDYERLCELSPKNRALIYLPRDFSSLRGAPRKNVFLSLPPLAFSDDLALLEASLPVIKTYEGVVCDNAYGVAFARKNGFRYIAGFGLNIANSYAPFADAEDIFFSVENTQEAGDCAVFGMGEFPLMTYAHCPYRVTSGASCEACAYDGRLTYTDDRGKVMNLRRVRVVRCYFTLNDLVENPMKNARCVDSLVGASEALSRRILAKERILSKNNYWSKSVT